jgi:hypothetical protein
MLRELLTLLRDRGAGLAGWYGHDREAARIAARHRRCRAAWRPHLEAVKALVLEAADAAPARGTAVILGSGPCLDVPVAGLCDRFRRVVLVDAHHPRPARALAGKYANLRLVSADVTGMGHAARQAVRAKARLPHPVPVPGPLPGIEPDFTASLNLASQLPIPFYKTLGGRVDEEELERFCRGLIEAHFAWMDGLPGRTCLVCDTAWERVSGDRLLETCDALEGVVPPPPDREWTWDIAPRPEESFAYDRRNRVWGYLDFRAARRAASSRRPEA